MVAERSSTQRALESHPDDGFFANEYIEQMGMNVLLEGEEVPELEVPSGGPGA